MILFVNGKNAMKSKKKMNKINVQYKLARASPSGLRIDEKSPN